MPQHFALAYRGMMAKNDMTKTTVSLTPAKWSAQLTGMKTSRTLSQLAFAIAFILWRQVGSLETVEKVRVSHLGYSCRKLRCRNIHLGRGSLRPYIQRKVNGSRRVCNQVCTYSCNPFDESSRSGGLGPLRFRMATLIPVAALSRMTGLFSLVCPMSKTMYLFRQPVVTVVARSIQVLGISSVHRHRLCDGHVLAVPGPLSS